jgi:8-oxo-dGTP pyrophosphatase MutT (NUDIX family)
MDEKLEKWIQGESEIEGDYRIFKIRKQRNTSPLSGEGGEFYIIECCDWINVIPITESGEVVMVKQYRHGTDEITLEIPGGAVDRKDTDPLMAAKRELTEETGYSSDDFIHLGSASPNPAILNNSMHYYFAKNVIKTDSQNLDPLEEINVELIPLSQIPNLIEKGMIKHTLVITAFYYYGLKYGFEFQK